MALTPEPAFTRTYDTSWRRARRSSGQVLNDQDGRLVGVIVANANDLERPVRPERDRVAGSPVRDGAPDRGRLGRRPVGLLELEG
jgi:hypothetical protein